MQSDDPGREWLRTTLDSIGDAVVTTGADGRIREMNPAAEALTGWSAGEAHGRPFADVFVALHEMTRRPVADPVDRILRDGAASTADSHALLVTRDGRERPVAAAGSPIRDAQGQLMGAVLVCRDQTEERTRLRALEDSERRHRDLFAANPQAMWIYDEDTLAFLDVNAAAIARYQYSRTEFLGMTLADIRPAEDVPAMKADAAAVPDGFEGGRRWRHRRRDGTLVTVEISSHPVPWPGRRARVVLAHDVTAQAALEARLRWQAQMLTRLASREPLQALLGELATFICSLCPGVMSSVMLMDDDGQALRPVASYGVPDDLQAAATPTPVREMSGVCGTAAARRAVFVAADLRSHPAAADFDQPLRRNGIRAAWSYPFFDTRDRLLGTTAMYVREARRPSAGEVEVAEFAARLAGVMTERSRDLEALHLREAQLRLIFENEPECVQVFDPEGRLLEMNPTGLRFIEADSIEQVRGMAVGDLVTPEYRAAFAAMTRDVAAGGDGVLEFEIVGLKGTRRHLEIHAAPMRDAQGRITAVLGIARDITERKALVMQLLQAQKLESVGRLAGGVAHDFNNMLSVIHGQTELALHDLPPDSPVAAGLREVLRAAERSAELTKQLLTFARREPSAPRTVDLNARVDELMGMLARLIGEGVSLAWQPAPGIWPVRIDAGQLDQILTNLVVNARDAMEGRGTMSVSTANVVRAGQDGSPGVEHVRLTVSDTGAGMDDETLARIFEPFFTTKPVGEGTGLGLSTVYGIVRQHGGMVEVESTPGTGTTFRLFLPRSPEDAATMPGTPEFAATRGGGRETILVVEDESALLSLICRVLRREGYVVLEADSPIAAEQIVRDHRGPLHLLLTDMVMPGLSGRELWRRVKPLRPELRCVLMSGYSREVIADVGDAAVAILRKPFPMAQLFEAVRTALDARPGAGDRGRDAAAGE